MIEILYSLRDAANEIERLREEIAELHSLDRIKTQEINTLVKENRELREALRDLFDEQNGPPLERSRERWGAAVQKARECLG